MKNTPVVDWKLCQACDPCLAREVCKTRAIYRIDKDEPMMIEPSLCTNCGQCVLACPFSAILAKPPSVGGR